MNGPKIYFTIQLFGGIGITQTTVSSFVVMLLLYIAKSCWAVTCKSGQAAVRCSSKKA